MDYVPMDQIFIIHVTSQDFTKNLETLPDLDEADQSLIIAGRKKLKENPIILTDDGELLSELIQTNISTMRLPVFLLMLIRNGMVSKNIGAKSLRFWEKVGRYKKQDLSKWKNELKIII